MNSFPNQCTGTKEQWEFVTLSLRTSSRLRDEREIRTAPNPDKGEEVRTRGSWYTNESLIDEKEKSEVHPPSTTHLPYSDLNPG